jgi:glycerate 2-kinase
MRLNVLIVPDKFKGTLTAGSAAEAIARGWAAGRPGDSLQLLPMSDGGDGFGEVMSGRLGAVPRRVRACDAAHRPCIARWWWHAHSRTAVIDTAGVVGLAMLPPGCFHPFQLDTFGLGPVIRAAAKSGARRLLVGLGGSATNDGGFGLARALGWRFLTRDHQPVESWQELTAATVAVPPSERIQFREVIVAVDVQNRLLGPRGASCVYGPQKGLKPADFAHAESCLRRLARLVRQRGSPDLAKAPGAGAAGGLGFGFTAFLGGRLEPGFELFAREVRLDRHLRNADVLITGEGSIDRSTFMGKGAGQVARRCRELRLPCIGFAGVIAAREDKARLFAKLHALTDLVSLSQAKSDPAKYLEQLANQVAIRFGSSVRLASSA